MTKTDRPKTDQRGIPFSNGSTRSQAAYEAALAALNSYFGDPVASIDAALADEPDFIGGLVLRAGALAMAAQREFVHELHKTVVAAETLASKANARERGHIAAARAWLDGDFAGATERWGAVAIEHPRDLLAVQLAHLGDFYNGNGPVQRDRIARVMPAWNKSVPGYGYVLGMYAFGLEEMGEYARAERIGFDALGHNPRDPWAVHALAHVYEMQSRLAEGLQLYATREADWAPDNAFAFHNWWHFALYHLDLGDTARVLDLYDTRIRPKPSTLALEMVDASAMLWRLDLLGVDVTKRFEALAECWAPQIDDRHYAFNDCHAVMAMVGAKRFADAERIVKNLETAARGNGTNARMSADVGLPLAKGLLAFGRGDYTAAADAILPIRSVAIRFGGSHAQRDILSLTAIEAAIRGGQRSLAQGLVAERLATKPHSPLALRFAARQRKAAGETEAAAKAEQHAAAIVDAIKRYPVPGVAA